MLKLNWISYRKKRGCEVGKPGWKSVCGGPERSQSEEFVVEQDQNTLYAFRILKN